MKRNLLPQVFVTIIIVSLFSFFQGCQDKTIETYDVKTPEYMTYAELREPVKPCQPEEISQPGKIYLKGDYIFVNEYFKGIHVINNEDPSNPTKKLFIPIPGNVDIAIKGNILYADSYVDLLVLDISDMNKITERKRVQGIFPYTLPPFEDEFSYVVEDVDEDVGVVISYQTKTIEEETVGASYSYYSTYKTDDLMFMEFSNSDMNGGGTSQRATTGVGGSMARFTLYEDYLYIIDDNTLRYFDISETEDPKSAGSTNLGWGIETLFLYGENLFIGTQTGMQIYDVSSPTSPIHISTYSHLQSCDPVVVEGEYAYVTLRAGSSCGNDWLNQLEVIDISDLSEPEQIAKYVMTEPYGLGIDDSTLFVCDGDAGLKIYNAADPYNIADNQLAVFPNINAFDVIPFNDILIMIGSDGLYQYSYDDITNITQLSFISMNRNNTPN